MRRRTKLQRSEEILGHDFADWFGETVGLRSVRDGIGWLPSETQGSLRASLREHVIAAPLHLEPPALAIAR